MFDNNNNVPHGVKISLERRENNSTGASERLMNIENKNNQQVEDRERESMIGGFPFVPRRSQ